VVHPWDKRDSSCLRIWHACARASLAEWRSVLPFACSTYFILNRVIEYLYKFKSWIKLQKENFFLFLLILSNCLLYFFSWKRCLRILFICRRERKRQYNVIQEANVNRQYGSRTTCTETAHIFAVLEVKFLPRITFITCLNYYSCRTHNIPFSAWLGMSIKCKLTLHIGMFGELHDAVSAMALYYTYYQKLIFPKIIALCRLCGIVVRVSGYRSRCPEFDSRPYQIFWEVGSLEPGSTQPREDNWGTTWMKK
jgi:hypothetical protein